MLFDSSRCRLLEWDQAQWRTEVIVSLRRMIYQWQCRSLHVSLTPPPPSSSLPLRSSAEARQDRGQAFCFWHRFPEHIEGLQASTSSEEEWGHSVLYVQMCRCADVHVLLTLSVAHQGTGNIMTDRVCSARDLEQISGWFHALFVDVMNTFCILKVIPVVLFCRFQSSGLTAWFEAFKTMLFSLIANYHDCKNLRNS